MMEQIICPKCGHSDDLDGFDVIDACNENLFCVRCHCEFNPDSGKIHEHCTTDCVNGLGISAPAPKKRKR